MDQKAANALVTGAPGTIKIGDRLLLIGQAGKGDYITLFKELKRQCKRRQKSPLAAVAADIGLLPENLQAEALRLAMSQQPAKDSATVEQDMKEALFDQLFEPEGCRFWLWLLARKHQPDLTLADIEAMVTESMVSQVLADLLEATGVLDLDPNSIGQPGSAS